MTVSRLITKMRAVSVADMILAGNINHALQANQFLRRIGSNGIEILVEDGVVTLSGHVGATVDKTYVDSAVRALPDVTQFENQLVADDKLTIVVAQAVDNDARMHGESMGVKAQHGFIYLTGRVGSAATRYLAAQLAADVSQVRGVVNRIEAPDVVVDDGEEQIFQPVIGQEVYTDSDELGHVLYVVINPHSRRVSAVVVSAANATSRHDEHTQQKHPIIIPISNLRCAPSGALFLNLRNGKTVTFVDFNTRRFVAPSADWQPPYPYRLGDILFYR